MHRNRHSRRSRRKGTYSCPNSPIHDRRKVYDFASFLQGRCVEVGHKIKQRRKAASVKTPEECKAVVVSAASPEIEEDITPDIDFKIPLLNKANETAGCKNEDVEEAVSTCGKEDAEEAVSTCKNEAEKKAAEKCGDDAEEEAVVKCGDETEEEAAEKCGDETEEEAVVKCGDDAEETHDKISLLRHGITDESGDKCEDDVDESGVKCEDDVDCANKLNIDQILHNVKVIETLIFGDKLWREGWTLSIHKVGLSRCIKRYFSSQSLDYALDLVEACVSELCQLDMHGDLTTVYTGLATLVKTYRELGKNCDRITTIISTIHCTEPCEIRASI